MKAGEHILGLIPARGGSKGVLGKNSKLLAGMPLVQYSIKAALKCNSLRKVVVSTDDPNIAEISKAAGCQVPFMRPAELATDQSPTIDTIKHCITFFEKQGQSYDAVCLLQPTVPFRKTEDIEEAIRLFYAEAADTLMSVREVPHQYNPHWTFLENEVSGKLKIATGDKSLISRRQDLPKAYHRDGSIYITKTQVILNQHSLYGDKVVAYKSGKTPDINIDTTQDWEEAEAYIKRYGS